MLERTFALIKPDGTSQPWMEEFLKKDAPPEDAIEDFEPGWSVDYVMRSPDKSIDILARIIKEGFTIVAKKMVHLSKTEAEVFYAEHAARPFFEKLTAFMSSGALIALVLERDNAVAAWRALMGPTDALKARKEAEKAFPLDDSRWSLRASFGTDGTRNATHGSDSAFSAMREMAVFFPELAADGWERSIAVVLPHALTCTAAIITVLEDAGFCVAARVMARLSVEQAKALRGVDSDAGTLEATTNGDALVLLVERAGAVKRLACLVGHATPSSASPKSLHALFGVNEANCGVVITPSADSRDALLSLFPSPLPIEATLCVVKPGTSDVAYRAIMGDIARHGFTVLAETRRTLSKEEAALFYAEHTGKSFFDTLTTYMSSGSVVALALAKPGAIRAWRLLCGPTAVAIAKRDVPASIRARFGIDGTRNAVHGSDCAAAAAAEVRFYFPALPLATEGTAVGGDDAIEYLKKTIVATVFAVAKGCDVDRTFEQVVIDGLSELCRARPSSDPAECIAWLGEWFVKNNPRRGVTAAGAPIIIEAGDDTVTTTVVIPVKPVRSRALARGAPAAAIAVSSSSNAVAAAESSMPLPAKLKTIVLIIGAPGAGKGTQGAKIEAEFGYARLAVPNLVRTAIASGSPLGAELAAAAVSSGDVRAPAALVLRLLTAEMEERSGCTKFLIDGFPRNIAEVAAFESTFGAPAFVLTIDGDDDETLEARLAGRDIADAISPGAETPLAAAPDHVRARIAVFRAEMGAVAAFYGKLALLRNVKSVLHASIEEVYAVARLQFMPQCVWLVGAPCAGRSTQAARVAAAGLGWAHLSSGELMRAEVARGTEMGVLLDTLMRRGDPAPTDIAVRLIKQAMEQHGPCGRYILDGAPCDLEQAVAFDQAFGAPMCVINLVAPDAVLLARARAVGAREGRNDIHAAVARRLLANYHELTSPVIALYHKQALVRTVDASGDADSVNEAFRAVLIPSTVFVLGGPGSGKGTQCAKLVSDFGYVHLCVGDLLRAEAERGTAEGAGIAAAQAAGELVPTAVTLRLIAAAMAVSRSRKILLDGFPRALDQALEFQTRFGDPDFGLFFDCPETTMRARLGSSEAAKITIARFDTFQTQTLPVATYLARQGKLRAIDATPPANLVYEAVRACFQPSIFVALGAPGSGKATQCARLAAEFQLAVLNTGDLLRAEVERKTILGISLAAVIAAGALVADSITIALVQAAIDSSRGRRFLLRGFPRTHEQAAALEAAFGRPAMVLHFDVPPAVSRARIVQRGTKTGRTDDMDDLAVSRRLEAYEAATRPIIRTYDALRLVRTVPAVAAVDIVYARTRRIFAPSFVVMLGELGDGRAELCDRAGRELGYATLDVLGLYALEESTDSVAGKALGAARLAGRTPPLDASLTVIKKAVDALGSTPRFILDGFPRLVSQGFPGVHDQIIAAEERLGSFKGAVVVTASLESRCVRAGAKAPGEIAVVRARVDSFRRSQLPVVAFMEKHGKLCSVDTSNVNDGIDLAFQLMCPFLE